MPVPAYAMLPGAIPMQPALGAIPAGAPIVEPKPREGRAIAALVLGIISIVAALLPICGLPFSVAGIVVSLLARRSASNRAMATVGLVLASIALGLTLLNAAAGIYLALHAR
jgi:hypothetical protein